MRSAECAPPDPDEILRTVASLAPSAKVTMKGGELTFEGEGQSASTTLDGLAARAGYLSLEYLQVSPSGWRARLGIRLLCRSIPSDTPTVFPLPEKTDWIRAGPDRERKWLAKSQSKIQELENSLGHDPVRHLNWLKKQVEADLEENQRPDALRGQLALIDSLLTGRPHRLEARFESGGFRVRADQPLPIADGWSLAPASSADAGDCAKAWCVALQPTPARARR
jgi:hypothetical protein